MTTLLIQIRNFFVIYVTILCKPICNPDALSSILHIRLYVPVDFIHFFFKYIFQQKSLPLPHPFHYMSISHPIPEIRLFQNLTLNIQGQGHGWGERWKSQSGCDILSTHMPFVPCQLALPFLTYSIFKIWPWKSKVKVKWPWCCTATGLDNSIEPQMV